jgi:hypothetical protein
LWIVIVGHNYFPLAFVVIEHFRRIFILQNQTSGVDMSNTIADTWIITGSVVEIDGSTPFSRGKIRAVDIYQNSEYYLGESGLDAQGNFTITFSKSQFQRGDSTREAPDVIVRVYDYQDRILFQSSVFKPSQATSSINPVLTRMPIPETWHVYGVAFNQNISTPFTQGKIIVHCVQSGTEYYLGENSFDSTGHFVVTFSRSQFQLGDVEKLAPDAIFRIYDYSNNLLWQSDVITLSSSEYYINPLIGGSTVPNIPEVPDNWDVSGSVLDSGSQPLSSVTVKAYDVLLGVETLLGESQCDAAGSYAVSYNKTAFQKGDSNRQAPNLLIKVFSSSNTLIAQSGQIDQAGTHAVIDIILAADEWIVSGTVRDSQGYLVTLGAIIAYDIYGNTKTKLGSVSLNSAGHYSIEFNKEDFQRGNNLRSSPNLQVSLEYPLGTVLVQSDVVTGAKSNQVMDLVLSNGSSGTSEYCVFGRITNKALLPVAHHRVEAYLLRIASGKFSEVLLGAVTTDAQGYYKVYYDPSKLEFPILLDPAEHGTETDSLFIQLPKTPKTSTDPAFDTSPIVCHSAKKQQIDFQVERASGSDGSEYDIVRAALSSFLGAMEDSLSRVEPGFSNRMQYISCKTGVEEAKVVCFFYSMYFSRRVTEALTAINSKLTVDTSCDFEKFMYATFRAGYSHDVMVLCKADTTEYYKALSSSIKNKIISEASTAKLPTFWEQWLKLVRVLKASAATTYAEASASSFANTILEIARGAQPSGTTTTDPAYIAWYTQKAKDDVKIQEVVRLYQEVQGNMAAFWDEMWANADAETYPERIFTNLFVTQLAFVYDLYAISNGFVPYAQGIYRYFATGKVQNYDPPIKAFNIQNLAGIGSDEWLGMTNNFLSYTKGEYPKQLVGSTNDEKVRILAMTALKLFKEKFPIDNAAEAYTQSQDASLGSIGEFLKSDKTFDLDTTNIDEYTLPDSVDKDKLKALQRVNRLTDDPDAQTYLLNQGYDSSYKISIVEEGKFIADHAEELGGIEKARQIHRLAVVYSSDTLSLLGKFHSSLNFDGNSMAPVSRGLVKAATSSRTAASSSGEEPVPTYETLFGTLSEVHFENSQSVFSASAYFVDLLEFIDSLNRKNLFSRRPELKETELTDKNAETVLPYIDIVLEMLENAVSPRQFFLQDSDGALRTFLVQAAMDAIPESLVSNLTRRSITIPSTAEIEASLTETDAYYLITGAWRLLFSPKSLSGLDVNGYLITAYPQTSKDSADLAVMPEHRNPLAYEALSELHFPMQLPLNPGADEIQKTMGLLGVGKFDSIVAFRRNVQERYTDSDGSLVCANLAISQGTRQVLEWSSDGRLFTSPWELWGLQAHGNAISQADHPELLVPGDAWTEIMAFVPEFMRRTGLDVEGMLDLFALRVLNADGHIALAELSVEGLQTGDPDLFTIEGLEAADLITVHRLIRLRNILDCSWKELDAFLLSAHGGLPASLRLIHVSKLFMERYSVSLTDLSCFWGPISAIHSERLGKSPFEERFLAKRLDDDAIATMKVLVGSDPDSLALGNMGDEVKQALQQVLRLSASNVETIIVKEFSSSVPLLNLRNVSTILRVALLVKALKIDVNDFYTLKEFTGLNPFNVENPEELLRFDDELSRLSDRGLKLKVIRKFLMDSPVTDDDLNWVQTLVQSIRSIVTDSETFLASDAVPAFDRKDELAAFKQKYRHEQTLPRTEALLPTSFAEFTGGDTELAIQLLDGHTVNGSKAYDLWKNLANAGWFRSLSADQQDLSDDFNLTEAYLKTANVTATWSAVFIAKQTGNLSFRLSSGACLATLQVKSESLLLTDGSQTLVVSGIKAGEAVTIKLTASAFTDSAEYYLDLQWNAATEENLSGSEEAAWTTIPVAELIPTSAWTDFIPLASTLPAFRKMSEYLELTGMQPEFFQTIVNKARQNSAWEILQPQELPLASINSAVWKRFTRLLDIQTLYTMFPIDESQIVLEDETDSYFWKMIDILESESTAEKALDRLCAMQSQWDSTHLKDVVALSTPLINLQQATVQDIVSPAMLAFILKNMPVLEKVGVPVGVLRKIQVADPEESDVADFRGALQIRLGIESWNEMVTAMMNALRIRQRDALVAFLTNQGPCLSQNTADGSYVDYLQKVLANAGVMISSSALPRNTRIYQALRLYKVLTGSSAIVVKTDPTWEITPTQWAVLDGRKGYRNDNDLYAHFLIDVQMNTDMITSRIVQGSAAIQLFVQRVLMGLESSSHLDDSDIEQWVWLKNYRLWEANRKVFLYPENWTEPELRDDKTPFFKEFEAEFESGDITSDIAKKALGNYLEKIRATSGLDIIGVYRGDSEIPRGKDTLHIIGKTKSSPYQYYYRRCHRKNNLPSVWTPWEIVSVDIQGNSVLPVMFNGQLHIFWAQFKPINNPGEQKSFTHKDASGTVIQMPLPQNAAVVDLSLCWSALVQDKWTEKKQTSSFIDTYNKFYTNQNPEAKVADHYHFRVKETSAEYLQIEVYKTSDDSKKIYSAGLYTIWHDGQEKFKAVVDSTGRDFYCDPQNTVLVENHTTSYNSQAVIRSNGTELFAETSSGYKLLTANSGLLTGANEPGFLMEDSRTYFIQRSDNGKTAPTYKMEVVSHPIVKEFQKRFYSGGLPLLMQRETQALSMAEGSYYGYSYYSYNYYYSVLLGYYTAGDWQAWDAGQNAFELRYLPNEDVITRPYPMDVVDFNYGTPNGIYNWELFFHAPFLVAKQLSANQRYDEAMDWFHLIFDPRNKMTGYEKTKRWALNLPAGARFWNFLPFFANADATKTISNLMGLPDSRGKMPDAQALKTLVDDWKNDPFNPHLIARSRIVAYQKAVIMHYLDTLVAWADQKFRQDTLESINEAIQLYILAAEVLGTRPQSIPSTLKSPVLSYTQMKKKNMDAFSNVVIQLENSLVKVEDEAKTTGQGAVSSSSKQALNLGAKMYFFTVPRNEKVMGYWDLLDDRLFKIRNGMNIEGVKRQLSLFAPPIDPGLLVRAAAAGIDIGTALNDLFAPTPQYRFTFMTQKAIELCNTVQSMGGAVLSALEKKDAEDIARLRAEHESTLLRLSKEVKQQQIEEATIALEGLKKTKATTEFRKKHYEELIAADVSSLEEKQLSQMEAAAEYTEQANKLRLAITATAAVPDFIAGASGFGGSPHITTAISVREMTKAIASVKASVYDVKASNRQNSASRTGIRAGYERRMQDWELQKALAEKELEGIEQQILGAQIRQQIAQKEQANLEKQISQSEEVYEFLKNKYTNKELYQWMVTELASLYSKNYQLAYDVAKRAEKSYGFELGITDSSFIQFGYWDGLHKGLLAGERLMLDLRRMEMSYVEKNKRELEITKPISIALLDPQAILDLQEKGRCTFTLPEALFDLDFPGHYFRRIRSVRLTIPCVAGPYTSVSAKLSLTGNSMRKSAQVNPTKGDDYPRKGSDDSRFVDQRIGIQGIATSQPNAATGMFDFNFRDERYLPFEGAGVISSWNLELPTELHQFDYRTISDVVLTISYTAREDGSLKNAANLYMQKTVDEYILQLSRSKNSLNRLISLKREFPDAYQNLLNNGTSQFSVTADHYPYFLKDQDLTITGSSEVVALSKTDKNPSSANISVNLQNAVDPNPVEVCKGSLSNVGGTKIYKVSFSKEYSAQFVCTLKGTFNAADVDDVLLNLNYVIA